MRIHGKRKSVISIEDVPENLAKKTKSPTEAVNKEEPKKSRGRKKGSQEEPWS